VQSSPVHITYRAYNVSAYSDTAAVTSCCKQSQFVKSWIATNSIKFSLSLVPAILHLQALCKRLNKLGLTFLNVFLFFSRTFLHLCRKSLITQRTTVGMIVCCHVVETRLYFDVVDLNPAGAQSQTRCICPHMQGYGIIVFCPRRLLLKIVVIAWPCCRCWRWSTTCFYCRPGSRRCLLRRRCTSESPITGSAVICRHSSGLSYTWHNCRPSTWPFSLPAIAT